jgi:hypothetical protein
MKTLTTIFVIIIVCHFSGCSVFKNSTAKSNDMFYYLGSGYDHEIVKVYFNSYEFQFEAKSDFSTGIVLSNYFQCSSNLIKMISNNTVIDSVNLNTCKAVSIKVQTKESVIEKTILSSKGQYVIIDKDKVTNELRVTQSKKPFSLE